MWYLRCVSGPSGCGETAPGGYLFGVRRFRRLGEASAIVPNLLIHVMAASKIKTKRLLNVIDIKLGASKISTRLCSCVDGVCKDSNDLVYVPCGERILKLGRRCARVTNLNFGNCTHDEIRLIDKLAPQRFSGVP